MTVPEWLRAKKISAQFRSHQDNWQPIAILLDEVGGEYATPCGNEEGVLKCLARGNHPEGGTVLVLHWLEKKGPFAGNTGIDTLWFQQQAGTIKVRGTFFADLSHDYGEIRDLNEDLVEMVS